MFQKNNILDDLKKKTKIVKKIFFVQNVKIGQNKSFLQIFKLRREIKKKLKNVEKKFNKNLFKKL